MTEMALVESFGCGASVVGLRSGELPGGNDNLTNCLNCLERDRLPELLLNELLFKRRTLCLPFASGVHAHLGARRCNHMKLTSYEFI